MSRVVGVSYGSFLHCGCKQVASHYDANVPTCVITPNPTIMALYKSKCIPSYVRADVALVRICGDSGNGLLFDSLLDRGEGIFLLVSSFAIRPRIPRARFSHPYAQACMHAMEPWSRNIAAVNDFLPLIHSFWREEGVSSVLLNEKCGFYSKLFEWFSVVNSDGRKTLRRKQTFRSEQLP